MHVYVPPTRNGHAILSPVDDTAKTERLPALQDQRPAPVTRRPWIRRLFCASLVASVAYGIGFLALLGLDFGLAQSAGLAGFVGGFFFACAIE